MKMLTDAIDSHDIELDCPHCRRKLARSISWLRGRRDTTCPTCETTIVLGTSRINAQIRNVERQMTELHRQLSEKFSTSI